MTPTSYHFKWVMNDRTCFLVDNEQGALSTTTIFHRTRSEKEALENKRKKRKRFYELQGSVISGGVGCAAIAKSWPWEINMQVLFKAALKTSSLAIYSLLWLISSYKIIDLSIRGNDRPISLIMSFYLTILFIALSILYESDPDSPASAVIFPINQIYSNWEDRSISACLSFIFVFMLVHHLSVSFFETLGEGEVMRQLKRPVVPLDFGSGTTEAADMPRSDLIGLIASSLAPDPTRSEGDMVELNYLLPSDIDEKWSRLDQDGRHAALFFSDPIRNQNYKLTIFLWKGIRYLEVRGETERHFIKLPVTESEHRRYPYAYTSCRTDYRTLHLATHSVGQLVPCLSSSRPPLSYELDEYELANVIPLFAMNEDNPSSCIEGHGQYNPRFGVDLQFRLINKAAFLDKSTTVSAHQWAVTLLLSAKNKSGGSCPGHAMLAVEGLKKVLKRNIEGEPVIDEATGKTTRVFEHFLRLLHINCKNPVLFGKNPALIHYTRLAAPEELHYSVKGPTWVCDSSQGQALLDAVKEELDAYKEGNPIVFFNLRGARDLVKSDVFNCIAWIMKKLILVDVHFSDEEQLYGLLYTPPEPIITAPTYRTKKEANDPPSCIIC